MVVILVGVNILIQLHMLTTYLVFTLVNYYSVPADT